MSKEYKTIETEVRLPYRLAYGEIWTRFFEGLKEEKIFGSKCNKCGRILVPARSFCPRCFVDTNEWVEMRNRGNPYMLGLHQLQILRPARRAPPYISALIRLDGTDVNFLHLVGGDFDMNNLDEVNRVMKNGMRVKAVWEEEKLGNMFDIKYFAPV